MKPFNQRNINRSILLLCSLLLVGLQDVLAQFQSGDVFVAVANGQVQRRSATGTLLQTLNTGLGGFTTGMAFDASDNLYVTNFSASSVSKFNNMGVLQGLFGSGYSTPESIVFDGNGDAYVGNLGNGIRKYNAAGSFLGTTYGGRVDFLDLSADQCTMLYTTEGSTIARYNVCTNSAGANFASGLGGNAYALRIRSNGEVLVGNGVNILRLNAAGTIIQTYDVAGENSWFALNLSPDGTSFWSADFGTSNVYRFDIATGAVLTTFNTGTSTNTVFGLAVFGEFQAAVCATNTAPSFTAPTPTCGSTIAASAGVPLSFTVAASDADAPDMVSLKVTGLPAGASMTPSLPTSGNPVSSTFSWTPTVADAGPHVVTFTIADKCVEVSCSYTINVAACVVSAKCKNAMVTLVNGSATITTATVDDGSVATCGIQSFTVSPNTFNCNNIGDNNITLTITDVNGNTSSCNAVVKVVGEKPGCSITAVPANNVFTGGVPTNLYIGYGPQSVTLNSNAVGGAPFTYSWSGPAGLSCTSCANPVFTATTPGTFVYSVLVKNSYGCTTTCSVTITVIDVRCGKKLDKVSVCQVPPGNPGNAHTICISENAVPAHLANGSYLGNCTNGNRPAPAIALEDEPGTRVLPNPNNGQFSLQIPRLRSDAEIVIINSKGVTIERRKVKAAINAQTERFDISKNGAGMYFIRITSGENVETLKVELKR